MLCSAVLESGLWAIRATVVLRVCKGDDLTVCMSEHLWLSVNDCLCFSFSYVYALNSTESPHYLCAHTTQDLAFSLNQIQTSTHAYPFPNHFSDNRNSD